MVVTSVAAGDEGQAHQMRRNAETQIDNATVTRDCLPFCEVNFYVMIIEEDMIKRINGFVNSLLGYEQQPPAKRVGNQIRSLVGSRNQIHQFAG